MMPGVNQSAAGGIASEATSGTCQNCTILNQSLHEYVAALLSLKQKIIDTDHLLCEYKEKCDELQKSQRESAKLHNELDHILLRLDPLEKQTAEYEAVKTELEETKATLKAYQVKSEELDALREENAKMLATNSRLQESIKIAEDAAHAQNQECSNLRSDNTMLQSDLQKTLASLKVSEKAVEEMENLKLQNAKALVVKGNLKNQLLALEDTNLKQNHTIKELKSKNSNLENSMRIVEERLAMFKKEFIKETRCSATQTENEPKVDKAKVWNLLQQVWQCVDPLSKTTENLQLNNNQCFLSRPSRSPPLKMPTIPLRNLNTQLTVSTKKTKLSPEKGKVKSTLIGTCSPSKDQKKKIMVRKKKSLEAAILDESFVKTDEVIDASPNKDGPHDYLFEAGHRSETPNVWEILSLSCSLPALLSPLPPDELVAMEVDASLTEGSILKTEDKKDTSTQSTEPNPHVYLSPENKTNILTTLITFEDTPKKVVNELQENIRMIQENIEVLPSITSIANLNNKLDKELEINLEEINESPQLNTKEESKCQINRQQQSNAGHELLQANCNCVQEGLEPVEQVEIFEGSPDKNNCVQPQSEVDANVPAYPLQITVTQNTCSKAEPKKKVEKIQSVLKMVDQNGVASEDSSDEDDFFILKRKVREGSLRPDLVRVPSNEFISNEKKEFVGHVQKTNCNLQTENVNNKECLKDYSIDSTMNLCETLISEDDANADVEKEKRQVEKCVHKSNSLKIIDEHNQPEDVVECMKVDNTKTNDPVLLSICPASLVNSNALSDLHKSGNISIDVASRNSPTITQSTESIIKVLSEMGPPLPPVVLPLTATPPKFLKHLNPNRPCLQLSPGSLTEGLFSPKQQSKITSPDPGLQDQAKASISLATPSPSHGNPSSPLQFGSATPKHALPVPGRLPSSALHSSSSSSQENSMQILDTMYPELSAQARTLNILRGNVNLGRTVSENEASSPPLNPISGNKTINSSSTAFKKTDQKAKRASTNVLLPKSAKRLRLDTSSPVPASLTPPVQKVNYTKQSNDKTVPTYCPLYGLSGNCQTAETVDDSQTIFNALEKLNDSYFDLLPVIRSHVCLGRISETPVLRDEEKSVISDLCFKQSAAEDFMLAILSKIKEERAVMKHELLQSYCRVYAGLCRWRGNCQKVHALAYSLLKEDFPEAPTLILFIVTTWPNILFHDSLLCSAVNIVSKLKAEGQILYFLGKYLHWEKEPPGDIHEMITTIIKTFLEDDTLMFQKHERHGYDLCPSAWDYIFSLDLLCSHLGWKWTHDNIIGKKLWPVMNAWVTQPRPQQTPVRDISVAVVLRLIGRLGQLGLKEKLCISVQNVAKAINLFGKHGKTEGVPWEVQLSAVYTIYDLAPSNPKEALEALATWRAEIMQPVPSAVTSCITQVGSVCRHIKP